jgi:hypothetical protein
VFGLAVKTTEFRAGYKDRVLAGLAPLSLKETSTSFSDFERTLRLKDKTMEAITADRVGSRRESPRARRAQDECRFVGQKVGIGWERPFAETHRIDASGFAEK